MLVQLQLRGQIVTTNEHQRTPVSSPVVMLYIL